MLAACCVSHHSGPIAADKAGSEPQGAPRRGRPPIDPGKRRQRILDAALALFLDRGFTETTVDAVAAQAGVTKRTIYEVVGDKVALFRAVGAEHTSRTGRMLYPELAADCGLKDALAALARALLDHAVMPARIAVARMIVLESMRFPDLARVVLEGGRTSVEGGMFAVFRHLEDRGVVRFPDKGMAAKIFYDVVVGNLGFRTTLGFANERMSEEEIDLRLDTFIRGFLRVDPADA